MIREELPFAKFVIVF